MTTNVLLDRQGPGVMDRLWFTNDAVTSISGITNPGNPTELTEWGNLAKPGKLRIEIDDRIVYDGLMQAWFSGEAQALPLAIRDLFVWHYRQFGANGNIIPLPYQKHIQVSVYGGEKKPKWFVATGMTLPAGTRVQSYSTLDFQDQQFDSIPHIRTKDAYKDDVDKVVFGMGYLEGNLTMTDGAGNSRYYSGQEDWAEGGYNFNLGYTTPSGGANRPFAGFFRYKGGGSGYASFFRYFNDLSAFRFRNGLTSLLDTGLFATISR